MQIDSHGYGFSNRAPLRAGAVSSPDAARPLPGQPRNRRRRLSPFLAMALAIPLLAGAWLGHASQAGAAEQAASAALGGGIEREVVAFRQLQTELMVAALACHGGALRARYNNFVQTHRSALKRNGEALKASFARMHGRSGQRRMDEFVTALANEAALTAIREDHFCSRAALRFEALSTMPGDAPPARFLLQAERAIAGETLSR